MKKLTLTHYLIIGLVILLVLQFIWYKREKQNLQEQAEKVLKEEKEELQVKIDSLTIQYESEINIRNEELVNKEQLLDQREALLNKSRKTNNYLNSKLKDYEKNLQYSDRTLDNALDVFSEYTYKGDSITTEKNR